MKLIKKAWLGLALSVGVLASGVASATPMCQGCIFNSTAAGTNLGILNPTSFDTASITRFLGNEVFSDWWVFTISPAGLAGINAIFLPTDSVSSFNITLQRMTANTCGAVTAPGTALSIAGACLNAAEFGAGNLGPTIGTNNGGAFTVNLPNAFLSAGSYAFHITGNSFGAGSTTSNLYSGNVTTRLIPEPGSLALAALGLLAAGVAVRRRA